jgi:hypothetical protein
MILRLPTCVIDKNNHKTVDCGVISKFKQQEIAAKSGSGKKFLDFLFEDINAFKRQFKSENTASIISRRTESLLSTKINLTTSSDEGENT